MTHIPTYASRTPRPLLGRAALITGSTSGIGLAIAEELAGQGAEIVLNGLGDRKEIEMACSRNLRRRLPEHDIVRSVPWPALQPAECHPCNSSP
jgi:NAD(P)-dependent dehydrogenase (short-subunit alcohol dehydrogenase family)